MNLLNSWLRLSERIAGIDSNDFPPNSFCISPFISEILISEYERISTSDKSLWNKQFSSVS